jgi:hypothetical protein
MDEKMANLMRPVYLMPEDVCAALESRDLLVRNHDRPAYQQNDYFG